MTIRREEKLFSEFAGNTKDEWLGLVLKDLPDKQKLTVQTEEGFDVAPFYTSRDLEQVGTSKAPGTIHNEWKYLENIGLNDLKNANALSLSALNSGADGIILNIDRSQDVDFEKLFDGIYPEHCSIYFKGKSINNNILNNYFKYIKKKNINNKTIFGGILQDPIAEWTLDFNKGLPVLDNLESVFKSSGLFINFKCFTINSEVFKNSGANLSQEAALTLSSFIAYITEISKMGISPQSIFKKVIFSISTGNNFFFEIAKLRALKSLITQISKIYGISDFSIDDIPLHVETSWWTKTAKDPYTNIIRNTTEAMSGILGGCSSLSILPHDKVINENNEFSKRISRNISNILKEEAYINKVSDPLSGSYYLENLTNMMAQKIWDYVQDIEKNGGFIEAFESGFIKGMVQPGFTKSIESVIKAKKKIIGSNYHVNQEDMDLVLQVNKTRKGWFEWDRLTENVESAGRKQ